MMSREGHADMLSGVTDEDWRLFRKGIAPAMNPVNIRCRPRRRTACFCPVFRVATCHLQLQLCC